jgi:hypothetical protein
VEAGLTDLRRPSCTLVWGATVVGHCSDSEKVGSICYVEYNRKSGQHKEEKMNGGTF